MAIATESFADLLERLGDISPRRIRLHPGPGTATEADLLSILEQEKRRYELVEATLVEKVMGVEESILASWIAHLLWQFLATKDIGKVGGEAAPSRMVSGLVRLPDVCFFSWERLEEQELAKAAISPVAPELAVEVISEGNTPKEIARKLKEYFESGVLLVWLVYPKTQTVEVYISRTRFRRLTKSQTLDGGGVLPGFKVSLKELFAGMTSRRKTHQEPLR